MLGTAWLAPLAGSPLIRRLTDAGFVRLARRRTARLDRLDVADVQARTLRRLVRYARDTRFGRDHDFLSIRTVADFQARVPVRDYEAFWAEYWQAEYPRLGGITWPTPIPYYALTSGTTTGSTKYIPVSWEMVNSNKKAAITSMSLFRSAHPGARVFEGKFFFVGGSTDLRRQADGSLAGDLSGIAAKEMLDVTRAYTFPPLDLSLISQWEVKLQKIAERSIAEPISAVSGVPSWILALFDRVKQITGKRTVAEVWPKLRLIVHGGTKFDPYRELFVREVGSDAVKFCEVYPCSEGFVATEDPRHHLMRLIPDHQVFFEFIPAGEVESARPTRHTVADVVPGVEYAVVLSTCAGLWAYLLGDTVTFESRDPPLLRFSGRTKYFLSAFGEHLIQAEVDEAVSVAARACGVHAVDHHVGPVFSTDPRKPGYHLYLVEFRGDPPGDLQRFARALDAHLVQTNEDYAAHRVGDLTMLQPVVRCVPPGGFTGWLKAAGRRVGGQTKVPRMDNSGKITRDLVEWLDQRDGTPSAGCDTPTG